MPCRCTTSPGRSPARGALVPPASRKSAVPLRRRPGQRLPELCESQREGTTAHPAFLWVEFGVQNSINKGLFHARYRCLLQTLEPPRTLEGGASFSRLRATRAQCLARPSTECVLHLSRMRHAFPVL